VRSVIRTRERRGVEKKRKKERKKDLLTRRLKKRRKKVVEVTGASRWIGLGI